MFLDHTQRRTTVGRIPLDELSARPEESYRLWCFVVCYLETSRMRRPWPALGRSATAKKKKKKWKIIILLSITILVLTGSPPLNAIDFIFCTDLIKPYSVIIWFNLSAADFNGNNFLCNVSQFAGESHFQLVRFELKYSWRHLMGQNSVKRWEVRTVVIICC